MTEPRALRSSNYDFIDVVRAVAAFVVVVSHTQQMVIDRPLTPGMLHQALSMVTTQGHNAVVVFFVVSGFWIVRSVFRAGDRFSFKDYLLARSTRLWIVLLPALLLGASLDLIGSTVFASPLYEGMQGSVSLAYDVSERLTWPVFLGNAFFLQDIAVPPFGSNGALWTLACEFWYYIYFPLAYLAVKSRKWWLIAPAAAALLLIPSFHLFLCWMLGGVVYLVAERLWVDRRLHWALPVGALVAFCGLNALSKLLALPAEWNDLLLAASFSLFLVFGMRSEFGKAKGLSTFASLGSRSSYSLYATHLPIVVFVCNFIVPNERLPASIYSWGVVATIPLIAVIAAILFSRGTEDQTQRVKHWLSAMLFRERQIA